MGALTIVRPWRWSSNADSELASKPPPSTFAQSDTGFQMWHPAAESNHWIALGLQDRTFEFRGDLQLIFGEVVQPVTNLRQLRLETLAQFGVHSLDFAHGR